MKIRNKTGVSFNEYRLSLTSDIKPIFETIQVGCNFYSKPLTYLIGQLEVSQLESISELTVEPNFESSQVLARVITYIPIGTLDIAEKTKVQATSKTSKETVLWTETALFNFLENS